MNRYLAFAGSALAWVPVALLVYDHGYSIKKFSGGSMYPFINPHYHASRGSDYVLVDRTRWWKLERGMVVAFLYTPSSLSQRQVHHTARC